MYFCMKIENGKKLKKIIEENFTSFTRFYDLLNRLELFIEF